MAELLLPHPKPVSSHIMMHNVLHNTYAYCREGARAASREVHDCPSTVVEVAVELAVEP